MIMQNKDFIIKQIAYGTRQMATGKWRWWFQPQNFLSESPFMRPATADPPWPFLAKRLQQPMVTCPRNAMYISIHSSKKLHFTNLFSSQISELPATKQRGTKKSLLWEGSKPSSKNAVFFFLKNPGHPWVFWFTRKPPRQRLLKSFQAPQVRLAAVTKSTWVIWC